MSVSARRMMVLIPYPSDIGFAIGRLIKAFFESACRVTGGPDSVYFCFSDISTGASSFLPDSFRNTVGFDVFGSDAPDVLALAEYVRAAEINILFALDLPVEAKCLGAMRRAGITTVVSYWGAPMSSLNYGLRRIAKMAEVRFLRRNRPDLFIFESRAMQQLAVSGRGVPQSQTTVVATGTDVSVFRPMPSLAGAVYERFAVPADRRIIVYMGHFHARKGVDILLRAADEIVTKHKRTDLHFLFLGTRDHEVKQLSHLFGESVAQGYVTFGGYHADVPTLLAGCHLGCIPSNGWDSFPMSSLEMQACALPVIVSSLQGVPETIEDGKTGLVFPSGDFCALAAMLLLLADNRDLHEKMSDNAKVRIQSTFTVTHYVNNLETAIRSVVER